MFLVITDAMRYILEAALRDKGKPTCRVTLTLHLITFAVNYHFTLSLTELTQRLKVYTIFAEFLFHIVVAFWQQRYKKVSKKQKKDSLEWETDGKSMKVVSEKCKANKGLVRDI
jgi:hypothetical protein